jgi:hypothetical protein
MFRACTVATIMAAGLAVAACDTDHSPTAPETGPAPSFRTDHSPRARVRRSLAGRADFLRHLLGARRPVLRRHRPDRERR